jgi:aldehyde dehydrogenase (NAD+)
MYFRDRLFIDGGWVASATGEMVDVVNPASEQVIGRAPVATAADIDRAVAAARDCLETGSWRLTPPAERAAVLVRATELLDVRRDEIRTLIIDENGSPFRFVEQAKWSCWSSRFVSEAVV